MGYADFLKDMLRPLKVYRLEDGFGASELEALGGQLDFVCYETDTLKKECVIPLAEGYGLSQHEEILPYIPAYSDIKSRRAAISALEQIDETCFTKNALNRTLSGCGITAQVEETSDKYKVRVHFPDVRGIPESINLIKQRVETILPCHLEVEYLYLFTTWDELERLVNTWNDLESRNPTFDDIETMKI